MEEKEDEPEDVRKATPVEEEIRRGEIDEYSGGPTRPLESSKKRHRCEKTAGHKSKGKPVKSEGECCRDKQARIASAPKTATILVYEKECILPKIKAVPRHCLTKEEWINILATPSRKCPSPCLRKEVTRKIRPVSTRMSELAQPPKQRLLNTLESRAGVLPAELIDNLIQTLEGETCLTPEQAEQIFRDKDIRAKKKCRKRKNKSKCKGEKYKNVESAVGSSNLSSFDKEAVNCQYVMAESFVRSILDWKCPIPKEEFKDIAQVILKRLSSILEYEPLNGEDRKSQQMRFLADIIGSWISGVLFEVAEMRRDELEEECERRRREKDEMSEGESDEDEDFGEKDEEDEDDDDDDGEEDDDDKGGKKKRKDDGRPGRRKDDEKKKKKKKHDGDDEQMGESRTGEVSEETLKGVDESPPEVEEKEEEETKRTTEDEVADYLESKNESGKIIEKDESGKVMDKDDLGKIKDKDEPGKVIEKAETIEKPRERIDETELPVSIEKHPEIEGLVDDERSKETVEQEDKVVKGFERAKEDESREIDYEKSLVDSSPEKPRKISSIEENLSSVGKLDDRLIPEERVPEVSKISETEPKPRTPKLSEISVKKTETRTPEVPVISKIKSNVVPVSKIPLVAKDTVVKMPKDLRIESKVSATPIPSEKSTYPAREFDDLKTIFKPSREANAMEIARKLSELRIGKKYLTETPFVTFDKIFHTIYNAIEESNENSGQDAIANRIHRAVYEKIASVVQEENPGPLTELTRDVIDVMSGKVALMLRNIITESQIAFVNKFPTIVESNRVRDWTSWISDALDTADGWSTRIRNTIKQAEDMTPGNVTRGDYFDGTRTIDIDGTRYRRFYLEFAHLAHQRNTIMRDARVVKTGTRGLTEYNKDQHEREIKITNLEVERRSVDRDF